MDLALAVHKINPAAEYRLTDDRQGILEWRGPGPRPTQAQLDAAWAALQAEQTAAAQAETARQQADADDRAAIAGLRPHLAADEVTLRDPNIRIGDMREMQGRKSALLLRVCAILERHGLI